VVLPDLRFGSTHEAFEVIKQSVESEVPGKGPKVVNVLRRKSDDLHEAVNFLITNYLG
jgi:hypothetical protein